MARTITPPSNFALRMAFICALLIGAVSFPEATLAQVYTVRDGVTEVYTRLAPDAFITGTLYAGDRFSRQQNTSANDWWGRCGGSAQLCGWVNSTSESGASLFISGGLQILFCSGSGYTQKGIELRRHLIATTGYCVNDYVPGKMYIPEVETGERVFMKTGLNGYLHGNHVLNIFSHPYTNLGLLTSNNELDWRYVTLDRNAMMMKLKGGPWGFMKRNLFPDQLPYRDKHTDGSPIYRTDFEGRNGVPR